MAPSAMRQVGLELLGVLGVIKDEQPLRMSLQKNLGRLCQEDQIVTITPGNFRLEAIRAKSSSNVEVDSERSHQTIS